MCGISVVISKNNQAVSPEILKKMNDKIIHRGPDDEGVYFNNSIGLGHRRLSIIDLSKQGHQPMEWSDQYVIVYNGEVYNYIEIRNELQKKGYQFKSKTDTEVVLAAYDYWGTECVQQFNGMWSFCIYDKRKNFLFLSRDRYGVKPLYYYTDQNYFYAFSEIKQILSIKTKPNVNMNTLADCLILGYVEHTDNTFFEDIHSLTPAHNLIYNISSNTFSIHKYYTIKKDEMLSELSEVDMIERYITEFDRSIEYRLRSDVKVGTCLSGGVDSSAIAAVAGKKYKIKNP